MNMKISILAITIMMSINGFAQDSLNCNYRVNEIDEFTNTSKVVTRSELYIAQTDSSLMKYYKRKTHSYFELETYCAKINDTRVLYTYIRIDSKNAYKYYGSLSTDAKVILKMEDGSTITLKIAKYDTGDMNYEKNYTSYSPYMIIDPDTYESLKTKKATKIRIYWSKGYEDYDVNNPNVLLNQMKCIE